MTALAEAIPISIHEELTEEELKFAALAIRIQEDQQLTRWKLQTLSGLSLSTVKRRIRKFKRLGYLRVVRRGSRRWDYRFTGVTPQKEILPVEIQEDGIVLNLDCDLNSTIQIELSRESESRVQVTIKRKPISTNPSGDPPAYSSNYYNLKYNTSNIKNNIVPIDHLSRSNVCKTNLNQSYISEGSKPVTRQQKLFSSRKKDVDGEMGEDVASVMGPDGSYKDFLSGVLSKPFRAEQTTFRVTKMNKYKFDETKESSKYTVRDMRHIFEQEWKKKGWKGFPIRWTRRDEGNLKELINEQGAENMLTVLTYFVASWEDICSRHGTSGYPNIRCLYGYRRSLVFEALNGKIEPKRKTVEWSGDGEDTPDDWEDWL